MMALDKSLSTIFSPQNNNPSLLDKDDWNLIQNILNQSTTTRALCVI